MQRKTGEERLVIKNGIVEVKNGEINGVEFQACHITLGPKVTMTDCLIDGACEVTTVAL